MSVSSLCGGRPALWRVLGFIAFLVFFGLYVWFRVDLRLVYHWPSPAFPSVLAGQGLFESLVRQPGGLVEYLCAFLFQLHYYAWVGALISMALAALLCILTGLILASLAGSWPRTVHLIPAVLLLLLHGRYVYTMEMTVTLAVMAACAWGWACLPLRVVWARALVFLAVSAIVYYLVAGAFIIWAVVCGLVELRRDGRVFMAALCLLAGALTPYAFGRLVLGAGLVDAYGRLLPYHPEGDPRGGVAALVLYSFLPVAALALALWPKAGESAYRDRSLRLLLRRLCSDRAGGWAGLAVLTLGVLAAWFSFRDRLHDCLEVERLSRGREWGRLLETARRVPLEGYDFPINRAVNRALYYEGQLLESMFSYPQSVQGLLPSHQYLKHEVLSHPADMMRLSDLLFDLGRVNESARLAHEALEHMGGRPWVIQRLAIVELVKGRADAAGVFLRALSADPICGGWARLHLERLQADPSLAGAEEIARVRSLMPVQDQAGLEPPEVLLRRLVERNAQNRMAFEYLVAHYLLTKNLEATMASVAGFERLDAARLPRHLEEAVLLYGALTGRSVDLKGRKVSEHTVERFHGFLQVQERSRTDPVAAAREALTYRDTYFYYFFYAPVEQGQ